MWDFRGFGVLIVALFVIGVLATLGVVAAIGGVVWGAVSSSGWLAFWSLLGLLAAGFVAYRIYSYFSNIRLR